MDKSHLESLIKFHEYEVNKWQSRLLEADVVDAEESEKREYRTVCQTNLDTARAKVAAYKALL